MDKKYFNLYSAWQNFVKTGEVDKKTIRLSIAESWLRSSEYGVDPYQTEIKPAAHLERLLEENRQLVSISKPYMDMVYNLVKGTGFLILLIDSQGFVLEAVGDQEALETARQSNLVPGANRLEEIVGTNAIGLALVEKGPVQIFGPEHYNCFFHNWTCSAAPIRGVDGEIMGVLNMSGHYSLLHKHTLGIVAAAVSAIEREFSLKQAHSELRLSNKYLTAVIDSVNEGILAVDQSGLVTNANVIALNLLGKEMQSVVGVSIDSVLETTVPFRQLLNRNGECVDREIYIRRQAAQVYCLLTVTPLKNEQGQYMGTVVIMKEKGKVHRLVHKMVGAAATFTFDDLIGRNLVFEECRATAMTLAYTDSKLLLEGKSGTGKEVFAQSIHNYSNRKQGPFVAVNCGAVPRELIESELFGYEEGAFTGARKRGKPGKFELAEGGTLFLDEVSDMPLDMQVKLLRVLQENQLVRVGGTNVIPLDVRIIASTNRDLAELVQEGSFREDLYYRLSVVSVKIPPLVERRDDIPLLVDHLRWKLGNKMGIKCHSISSAALDLLIAYNWPGNIRELENVVERAIIFAREKEIAVEHLPQRIQSLGVSQTAAEIGESAQAKLEVGQLKERELKIINETLEKTDGNVSKAAELLGVSRNTIYNKLKKAGA